MNYEDLVSSAVHTEFKGWDFSYVLSSGRMKEDPLSWSYEKIVKEYFYGCRNLLDMGTGGGEVLSSLIPLPQNSYATESYIPNVEVAKLRLEPLGVKVVYIPENPMPPYCDDLPFECNYYDLIINRHEAYMPKELFRILKNNGSFITQQVGFLSAANLIKDMLGKKAKYGNWNLQSAITELKEAGFKIIQKNEEISNIYFFDVGALVYYLRAIPWLIGGFTSEKYDKSLRYIHEIIESQGYYQTLAHRFLIIAQKN